MATAAAGGAKRRKSAVPGSGLLGRSSAGQGRLGEGGEGTAADGDGAFGADGWFSNASLHLQAAAAEEAAAAAELAAAPATAAAGNAAIDSAELRRLQQQEALLRPVAQPRLPEVQTQLSSIWELLGEVQDGVHGELQQLFKSHTWVGMVSGSAAAAPAARRLGAFCSTELTAVSADVPAVQHLCITLLVIAAAAPAVEHMVRIESPWCLKWPHCTLLTCSRPLPVHPAVSPCP